MKLAFVTVATTSVESKQFAAGESVAVIDTDLPLDRLQSLLDSRMLNVVPLDNVSSAAKPIEEPKAVEEETQNDDEPEVIAEPVAPAETPVVSAADIAAMEFPGLKERIAIALIEQGIGDAESLRGFVDDGKDLIDLDAIGRAAKIEILAWLDANLPSDKTEPQTTE